MFRAVLKMTENAAKRLKTTSDAPVKIGTHNGHFHADEALAVHMLRRLPTYASASLVRTRDPALLETCHTVVDVGGEYDPSTNRYDHHQRTFDTTFPGRSTKLSSAGLVYLHFGKSLVAQDVGEAEDSDTVGVVWNKMYESFVEALDAHDNGISSYDHTALKAAGIEKRYSKGGFGLGAVVNRFNARWNEPIPSDPVEAQAAEDARFEQASKRIGEEFDRDLLYFATSWLPARSIVQAAYAKRFEYDPSGRIMVFEGQSVPWKDHLYTIEEEEAAKQGETEVQDKDRVLYVLYPEKPTPDSRWRVQAVSESRESFQNRKSLPEPWRGARDEALDELTGIPGSIFVHAAGFIGGHKTFEGAKAMADKACTLES